MGRLRITGGYLKGRNIATSTHGSARYTSSMVREAIFNLIGDINGCRILDLFAGSGSFTVEAISRGADAATCVEMDGNMADILKKNLSGLLIDKDCLVLNMDVRYAIPLLYKRMHKYDIIFMDPPYKKGLVPETMFLLTDNAVYDNNALFITECAKREGVDLIALDGYKGITSRRYGDTNINIFKVDDICR